VTLGSVGVMCQLDAVTPFLQIVTDHLTGFLDPL